MKRTALALVFVAASTTVASAGGYVGLGIGTAPAVKSSRIDAYSATAREDGRSGRLIAGFRFGRISVEGAVGQFDFVYDDGNRRAVSAVQAQISGKYSLPLQDGFGLFGRVGLVKNWFSFEDDDTLDVSGSGVVAGAGFEYRLPTVLDATVFVEYQYSRGDMSGDRLDFGSTNVRMWTLGATLGF